MLSGLPYVTELQHIGNRIAEYLLLVRELETGLSLLWGVVSWPLLGVLSVLVIFRGANQVRDENPLSKKLKLN